MHHIRTFLTVPLGVLVIIMAVANRHDVVIKLWPLPWSISVQLYALILLTFALGVLAGGLAMWTGRIRKQRRQKQRASTPADRPVAQNDSTPQTVLPRP